MKMTVKEDGEMLLDYCCKSLSLIPKYDEKINS